MEIDIRQLIKAELGCDEELLWEGQPRARIITVGSSIAFIFGIIFTAFSLFWTTSLLEQNSVSLFPATLMDRVFPFFSIPFLAIGIFLLFSPYWMYRGTQRTVFAITNRRCIIIKAGKTKKVKSYNNEKISNIEKVQYANGFGDLIFAKEQYTTSDDNNGTEVRMRNVGFYYISGVNEVERILKAAIRKDAV